MPVWTDRSEALSLDLARLQKVAASVGCRAPAELGPRLAGCSAADRSAMAQAFAAADAMLPADISKARGPVDATKLEHLRAKGCLDLGQLLGASEADDVRKHLGTSPLIVGRAPSRQEELAASLEDVPLDK